jgi:hypothetical protein
MPDDNVQIHQDRHQPRGSSTVAPLKSLNRFTMRFLLIMIRDAVAIDVLADAIAAAADGD